MNPQTPCSHALPTFWESMMSLSARRPLPKRQAFVSGKMLSLQSSLKLSVALTNRCGAGLQGHPLEELSTPQSAAR